MGSNRKPVNAKGQVFRSMQDFERSFYPSSPEAKRQVDVRATGAQLAKHSLTRIARQVSGK